MKYVVYRNPSKNTRKPTNVSVMDTKIQATKMLSKKEANTKILVLTVSRPAL
jgi:hypothetical protein